jgi:hypothetical protein
VCGGVELVAPQEGDEPPVTKPGEAADEAPRHHHHRFEIRSVCFRFGGVFIDSLGFQTGLGPSPMCVAKTILGPVFYFYFKKNQITLNPPQQVICFYNKNDKDKIKNYTQYIETIHHT